MKPSLSTLTPSLWLPIPQPWQQRWVPRSSGSFWRRTPWWWLRPSPAEQNNNVSRTERLFFPTVRETRGMGNESRRSVENKTPSCQFWSVACDSSPSRPPQSPSASLWMQWSACGWPARQRGVEMIKKYNIPLLFNGSHKKRILVYLSSPSSGLCSCWGFCKVMNNNQQWVTQPYEGADRGCNSRFGLQIWYEWQGYKPFIDLQFYSWGVLSRLIHHFLNTQPNTAFIR